MPDSAPDRIHHRGCVLLVYRAKAKRDWRYALYRNGRRIGLSEPFQTNGLELDALRAVEIAEKVAELLWPEARVVLRDSS